MNINSSKSGKCSIHGDCDTTEFYMNTECMGSRCTECYFEFLLKGIPDTLEKEAK